MKARQVRHSIKILLILWLIGLSVQLSAQEDYYSAYTIFVERYLGLSQGNKIFTRTGEMLAAMMQNTGQREYVESIKNKKQFKLEDLLFLLFQNNPSIQSARQSVMVAHGNLQGAKAQRLPVFKLETSGTYIGNPVDPIVIKKGEFGIVDNQLTPGTSVYLPPEDVKIYQGMENTLYQFKIVGDMPLWTWGKISLGIDAGYVNIQAAELYVKKIIHEKSIRLRGIFESLCYIKEIENILKLEQKIGARLLELTEQNKKAGFITETDYLTIKINIKEIDLAVSVLNEKKQKLLTELAALTGLKSLTMESLSLELLPIEVLPLTDLDTLRELTLYNNYDILLGSIYLEAKQILVEIAQIQAKGLPDLGLHLEVSYSGPRFPFIETDWARKDDYQITISIATQGNIFGSPGKKAEAEKARAELEEGRVKLEEGKANLILTLDQTMSALNMLVTRIEYAMLKQELYVAQLASKKVTISMGSGSEADFLNEMLKALSALSEAYSHYIDYRTQLLTIDILEGGYEKRDSSL
ncbi:MAG TPA: TolC family protein [Spirochaetales bacterium]|nr:TolC family protein [Spirochaetales bacterium]HQK33971.1 TolC family protein [Spirochaetales bacterium]